MQKLDIFNLAQRFVKMMLRMWYVVLALIVACSLFFSVRAYRSFTPMYQCSVTISVKSNYVGSDIFTVSYYDNSAAQQLVEAFPNLLSTDLMRDLILQELGTGYINGTTTATVIPNTNMVNLTVRSRDPQAAYDILRATVKSYPEVALYMIDNPQTVVMNEAKVPQKPYNSFSWKSAAIRGGLVGGMIAVLLIIGATFLTRVVTSVEQLKSITNLPILAVLPKVNPKKRKAGKQVTMDVHNDPGMIEALHGLSLKMRKTLAGEENRVILITSSVSGEGKTTLAVNLARTMAEDGSRVVVVDADLRKQSVAVQLGRKETGKGLMGCLTSQKLNVLDYVHEAEENLHYISGRSVRKAHYSIDSRRMKAILAELNEAYDYVIVDTPPCSMVADTMLLSALASLVLYTVRPDRATEPQIVDHITAMYERDIPIEGFVFNGQSRSRAGYGYGRGYGYGYKNYGKKS